MNIKNIKEEKNELRKKMKYLLKAQTHDERIRKSELIINKVLNLEIVKRVMVIMVYISDAFEVQTHSLIRSLVTCRKKVVVPFLDASKNIIPCEISDLETDTEMSPYGYREPTKEMRTVPFDAGRIEAIIVPGVAFDTAGHRLGRGWGCYDRFLKGISSLIPTIGIAFDFQICAYLPTDVNDVPLSAVISN